MPSPTITDEHGIPVEDSKAAKSEINAVWADLSERLYTKVDDICRKYDIDEAKAVGLLDGLLGDVVAEGYEEWIGG